MIILGCEGGLTPEAEKPGEDPARNIRQMMLKVERRSNLQLATFVWTSGEAKDEYNNDRGLEVRLGSGTRIILE